MSNTVELKVSEKKDKTNDEVFFEGTVTLPGLKPTKLVKSDGTTRFAQRSHVVQSGKRLANKMSFCFENLDSQPVKKAAKKNVKKTKTEKSSQTECSGDTCSAPWVAE